MASGVAPGDQVAIWAFNCAEWVIAMLGVLQAGAVLVPVNTRFKGTEASEILARSRARVLVTVTDFLGTDYVELLTAAGAELPALETLVVARGPTRGGAISWGEFTARASADSAGEVERRRHHLASDDVSDILFTSGTTGAPKGVVMTHARTLRVATDWVEMTGLRDGDRYLMVNPYFHMFGLKAGILASLASGAIMLPEAVFDVERVLARVASERVTVLPGPPTLYRAMLDAPDRDRHDLSSLRVAVTGAADIPVELVHRMHDELPFSTIITGYGLTEAGTVSSTSPGDDAEAIATTVGRPRPGFELRITDDGGAVVAEGQPGEVVLRGASVMAGYLDDPAATTAALSADGWLRTGDLGVVDGSGRLRIVGRLKDMFIVGGFNAYPAEIENALLRHPEILQAAVIGVPDRRLGEVAMAFVVTRPGVREPGATSSVVSGPDGELPRSRRRDHRRAPAQRHRQGREGRPAGARRVGPAGVPGVSAGDRSGLASFQDLKVVELGVWVAAPAAAALLADWGADVVKVEPPAGDPMRYVFGSIGIGEDFPNPAFALDNRGKRSVVLDLRQPADGRRLEELLAGADVFVSNLRPDALDRLGLEPAATVERHPHLVYCSISGYGLAGGDRNRPAYDIGAFWARSGLSVQMADADGAPLNPRGGIGDHITGLAALAGMLAAVLEQRHTGRGQVVEVSLLRSGAYALGWDLGLQMALGKVAGSEPRERKQAPLMNPYRAGDGRWFFLTGLEADRHLPAVCRALGRPDLLDDPRFASASAIRRHREHVIAVLDAVFAERPLDEWAERFDREGVWWAPAQSPAEVVDDPQLLANDGFVDVAAGASGPAQRSVNGPVSFSALHRGSTPRAPALGQDTDDVLGELRATDSSPDRPRPGGG